MKIIGIGGVARAGKNTFANLISELLPNTVEHAFARKLKQELDPFILDKYGFSAFTENDDEKRLIRPLFEAHGEGKRKQTKGAYWINSVLYDLTPFSVNIITDVRYLNEVKVIQEMGGKVIHLTRFEGSEKYLPVNETERANDPDVESHADYRHSWLTFSQNFPREKAKLEVKKILNQLGFL